MFRKPLCKLCGVRKAPSHHPDDRPKGDIFHHSVESGRLHRVGGRGIVRGTLARNQNNPEYGHTRNSGFTRRDLSQRLTSGSRHSNCENTVFQTLSYARLTVLDFLRERRMTEGLVI